MKPHCYTVFNAEQVEGLPVSFYATVAPALSDLERISATDRFFAATGSDIRHGGSQVYSIQLEYRMLMPPFEAFKDQISYYATLAYELTHWTKHMKRLDWIFGRKNWDDPSYAMEELVAELGAAFLAADLGLEAAPRPDHAAYLASWLVVMKSDKRAIFSAASHAQRAVDFS